MTDETKLSLASLDVTAEVLAQLREIAPQVFTEDRVDFDKLKATLGENIVPKEERYGLNWAGKSNAFRNVQIPSVGTLIPQPEESVNFDTSENLIIEGDNLEVLKLLQKSYHGKVKMIYIDPPYNTGNEFIYPDNFREGLDDYLKYSGQVNEEGQKQSTNTETSGRFHSTWLNMMYPRLFLARNLLQDNGMVIVSIDDNEVHNLRMLLNEVFGEENFIDCVIWKKRYGGGAKEKHLVSLHEYALVYAKNIALVGEIFVPTTKASIERYYKEKDENYEVRGAYRTHPLEAGKAMGERKNLVFPIEAPDGSKILPKRQWLWSKERVDEALKKNEIAFLKDKEGNWTVHPKQYLMDEAGNVRASKAFSIVDNVFTQHGTNEIIDLFGDAQLFPYPKPTNFIKYFLQIATSFNTSDVILDFFAGSGTTAHAVLDANNEDGGNRKFILVQLPEKTDKAAYPTITHITRERVRRAINKLNKEPNLLDQDRGFKALKLASSNFKIWNADTTSSQLETISEQLRLYADNVERERNQQDILYELILKSGMPLSAKIELMQVAGKPVYSVAADEGNAQLLICLENEISQAVLRGMIALSPTQMVCLDRAFGGNDQLKTNTVLEAKSQNVTFRTV